MDGIMFIDRPMAVGARKIFTVPFENIIPFPFFPLILVLSDFMLLFNLCAIPMDRSANFTGLIRRACSAISPPFPIKFNIFKRCIVFNPADFQPDCR